jgi:hypothetical protein
MMTLFWLVFWAGLAALVVAAGFSLHVRRREAIASTVPVVDDAAVERILSTGRLTVDDGQGGELGLLVDDEATSHGEADDEEERFWSESWDEPTEW